MQPFAIDSPLLHCTEQQPCSFALPPSPSFTVMGYEKPSNELMSHQKSVPLGVPSKTEWLNPQMSVPFFAGASRNFKSPTVSLLTSWHDSVLVGGGCRTSVPVGGAEGPFACHRMGSGQLLTMQMPSQGMLF